MTNPDYRAALAEPDGCDFPVCIDDDSEEGTCSRWLAGGCEGPASAARAALAEQPVGPTDEELLRIYGVATPCYHVEEYKRELDFARAVLARWGRPAAAPVPEPGEVAELVADELVRQLRTKAATEKANRCHYSATLLTRAADLLQHQHPQPVAVSERMPEPNVKVLAHYFNALGKGRTICAIWVPAKSRSDEGDLDADDFLEYDEEGDKYHWPEGWYEAIENWEELGWAKVYEGEIAYWQPLPQWPAHALPLPTPEATND